MATKNRPDEYANSDYYQSLLAGYGTTGGIGPELAPFQLGNEYGGTNTQDQYSALRAQAVPGAQYQGTNNYNSYGEYNQYAPDLRFQNFDPSTYDPRVGGAGASMGPPKDTAAAGMRSPSQNAAGGGYNLGGEMNSIAQGYQTRLDELNRQRDAGGVQLAGALQTGRGNLAKRVTDNTAENDKTNSAIQASYAQAMERQRNESAAMVAELKKMGIDPSRLAPAATQAASFLEQSGLAQGALTQRMGQISNDTLNARQQSLDLIDTGAQGQLTNNYSRAKMQMDLQRQAQEDQARQASAAAAARAPSEFEQAMNELKYEELYNKTKGINPSNRSGLTGDYDISMLSPGTPAYNVVNSGSKNVEADLRKYYTNKVENGTDDNGNTKYVELLDQNGYDQAMSLIGQSANSQRLLKQDDSSLRNSYESNARGNMGGTAAFEAGLVSAADAMAKKTGREPDYSMVQPWARPQTALTKMSYNGRAS